MNVGDLRVNLKLNADGFDMVASRAGQAMRSMSRQFDMSASSARRAEEAMQRVGSSFRRTIVTLGALRFALMDLDDFLLSFPKSVANTSGEMQRMQTLMTGLSKSGDKLTRTLEGMRDMSSVLSFAKNAPFDVKALSDVFVKLKTAGLDPMAGSMTALTDSVAKFGGTPETMRRAAVAIQQMSGKGVISMEELRQQLGEAVPNAMQLMAAGLGMTVAQLTEKVSKGIVKSDTALAKMFAQMRIDSKGAAKEMLNNLPGAIQQLKTEYELFQKQVGDRGFTAAITATTREITEFFQSEDGKTFARDVGNGLRQITESLISMGRWLSENISLVKSLGILLVSSLGGSKLAGVWQNMSRQAAAQRAEALNDLRSKNAGIAQQMASAMELGKRERAQFEVDQRAKIAGIEGQMRIMEQQKAARLRQIEELRRAESAAAAEAQRYALQEAAWRRDKNGRFAPRSMYGDYQDKANAFNANAQQSRQEIEMNQRAVESRQRLIEQSRARVATLAAERAQLSAHAEQNERIAAQMRNEIAMNQRRIQSMTGIAGAFNAAGVAARGFGLSLLAGLAWAGAFFIAVEGLVWVFGKFTEGARKAEEAQQRLNRAKLGQSLDEDAEKLDGDIAGLRKTITTLEEQRTIKQQQINNTTGKVQEDHRAEWVKLSERIDAATSALKRYALAKEKALVTVGTRKAAESANQVMADLERKVDMETGSLDIRDRMRSAREQLDKLSFKDQQNSPLKKKIADMGLELANAELAAWTKFGDASIKGLGDANDDSARAIRKFVRDRQDAVRQQRDAVASTDIFTTSGKPAKGPKDNWLDNFIEAQREQSVQLRQSTEQLSGQVMTTESLMKDASDRIDEMVKRGDGGVSAGKDAEKIGLAKKLLGENMVAKETAEALQKLQPILASIKADQERIDEVFANGGSEMRKSNARDGAVGKLLAELEPKKELLKKTLSDIGMSWEQFVERLQWSGAESRMAATVSQLINEVKSLEEGNEMDDRQRQRRITQNRIEEITKRVNADAEAALMTGTLGEEQAAKLRLMYENLGKFITAENERLRQATMTAGQRLAYEWSRGMRGLEESSARWADNFVDQLAEGKFKFSDFIQSILADLAKLKMKQTMSAAIGGFLDIAVGAIGGYLGLGGGASAPTGGSGISLGGVSAGSGSGGGLYSFANGGIMTRAGALQLHKYANGGVANTPQLAMFGEGRTPEAYVPLPDGRTIPVTMQGGGGGGGEMSVVVNVINQTGQQVSAQKSQPRFDGKQMILDVFLDAVARPGPFRDNARAALK